MRCFAGNLTETEGLGLPNVFVPKSVPEFDVVEMLADEAREGGPQDAVAEGVLRQCGGEEVDVIHRPGKKKKENNSSILRLMLINASGVVTISRL